ncbi:hypothetical protein MMC06_004018 [Schaereria dolodes]|nr:hypothetical protein [Schaereria dolodes]
MAPTSPPSSPSSPSDLFASPSKKQTPRKARHKDESLPKESAPSTATIKVSSQQPPPRRDDQNDNNTEAHEASLHKELANVRHINEVIEGVLESLERARSNMDTVSSTVTSSTTLLDTWTRILSQTEHNQRLLLNPSWHGASQDIADVERESLAKEEERERREFAEARRREERARKEEDEEKRREAGLIAGGGAGGGSVARGKAGVGGRVRGRVGRGGARGAGTARGQGDRGGKTSGGVGRGVRGRGRGLS